MTLQAYVNGTIVDIKHKIANIMLKSDSIAPPSYDNTHAKRHYSIQIPSDDKHFGGVIFTKGTFQMLVINTAQHYNGRHFL